MSEYDDFLQALAKNEDDTTLRLVFADWLDERGEHEEADRQRRWPVAKAWFQRFCYEHNPPLLSDTDVRRISPEELVELGGDAIRGILSSGPYIQPEESFRQMLVCGWDALERSRLVNPSEEWEFDLLFGNHEQMRHAIAENVQDFWKNWSIVTGVPLPPGVAEKSRFYCSC